jgi:uncharacterized protein
VKRSASPAFGTEMREGMRIDWDVPIAMDNGIVLRADVLMTYGPYAKGLAFQEKYPTAWTRMAENHPDCIEWAAA